MKQLDKKTTQLLEQTSVPIIMRIEDQAVADKWFHVLGWTHNGSYLNNEITNKPLKTRVAAMAELLGFRQNYHVVHSERNAVWGLEHNDITFLVYISNSGLAVQLEQCGSNALQAETIVGLLHDILIGDNYVSH